MHRRDDDRNDVAATRVPSGVHQRRTLQLSYLDERLGTNAEKSDPRHDGRWLPTAGEIVGRYQILGELGRGGMGVVFLARDVELRRLVALKILDRPAPRLVRLFKEEAATTARCPHESIVRVYDISEHRGHPYIVLEHIAGKTLRAWIRENEPAIVEERALSLMIPVVRALVHAHRMGVIHRDLKPENIMVGNDGSVKVLDFGIARIAHRDPSDRASLGADDESNPAGLNASLPHRSGTLPYMSPEQYDAAVVDQRSDIWAVGVILCEILTGRHPLAPLSKHKLDQIPRLDIPMPSLARQRPDLGELAQTIDRCLRKVRTERLDDSQSLLAKLEYHAARLVRA